MGVIYGSSFYEVVNGLGGWEWENAEAAAEQLGGHLITINTKNEWNWFKSEFTYEKYGYEEHIGTGSWQYPNGEVQLWIGLNDAEKEGVFTWSSGEKIEISLDDINLHPFNSDKNDFGIWLWEKQDLTLYDKRYEGRKKDGWTYWANNIRGVAEVPLSYFSIADASFREGKGGEITINRTGGTTTAQTLRVQSSDGTATIADDDYTAIDKTITFAKGETSKTISISTTADLDVESDESFKLKITAEGSDEVPPQISDETATVTIKADDYKRGDSLYTIVEGPSWTQAENEAKRLGGNLVTINDSTENSWLTNKFEDGLRRYYIGLNDKKRNQTYEWISGQVSNYRNWFPYGEPNGNTSADVVELVPNEAQGRFKGGWNDLPDNSLDIFGSWNSTSGIAEIPLTPSPTYLLSTSTSSIDEATTSSVRTTISTTGVDSGTRLYYTLSGSGVTASDFSSGDIKSSRLIGSDGKATFVLTASADKTTEGPESFTTKLYTDYQRTNLVETSSSVSIADTSKTPTPTYSISSSPSSTNEGGNLTTTVSTTNVSSGTTLYFSLSGTGVDAKDFSSGSLTGSCTTNNSGSCSLSHSLKADKTTEGIESFNINLYTDSDRTKDSLVATSDAITIKDTSKTPAKPTYSLSLTPSSIDEGDSFRASITTTDVAKGTKLFYSIKGDIDSSDLSGDLNGSITLNNSGSASFTRRTTKDLFSERTESADVILYTDSQRTLQVAKHSLNIRDTSKTPKKAAYSISLSPSNLKEGDQLTTSISTENVDPGTTLHWALTGPGINAADFSAGSLSGKNNLNKSGAFSLSHAIAQDLATEGSEQLTLQLFSDSDRNNLLDQHKISIADTSKTPQSASLLSASINANTLSLTFDGELDNSKPSLQRFSISADGKAIAAKSAAIKANSGTLELTLASPIKPNQDVQLAYNDLKGNQSTGILQTPDGTDLPSFSTAVTNTSRDNTPPSVQAAYANAKTLTLSLSEALDTTTPSNSSWTLREDGKAIPIAASSIDAIAAQLILTLTQPVDRGSELSLSYRDLAGNQKSNVIQDLAGNDLASLSNLNVENRTTRSSDPLNINTAEIDADEIVLAFDRELDSTTPSKGTFRLAANGKTIKITRISLYPKAREAVINLAQPVEHGADVSLSYTDAKGNQKKNVIQDIDGNDLATITGLSLTNNTRKNAKAFSVDYADADRSTINLYLTGPLSKSIPNPSRFRITADNKRQLISSVSTDPANGLVTLNLKKNLNTKQDILISYRDLNGDQSSGIIEDNDGNDLPSFSNLSPLNDTTDSDPPSLDDAYLDGKELVLEFDELLSPGNVKASRFKVRADKKRIRLTSASVPKDDSIAILNLKSLIPSSTKELSLTYKDLKGDQSINIIQDLDGNDLNSLRNFPVEIISTANNNFPNLA